MSWGTIIFSFVNALLGAGLANFGFQWWREHRGSKRNAAWLALQLAVLFEKFGTDCLDASYYDPVLASEFAAGEGDPFTAPMLPPFPAYPKDEAAWRLLDLHLVNSLLVFPEAIRVWQLESSADFLDDPRDGADTFKRGCVSLARRSLRLAATLRQQHDLPQQEDHLLPAVEERARAIHVVPKEDPSPEANMALALAAKKAAEARGWSRGHGEEPSP